MTVTRAGNGDVCFEDGRLLRADPRPIVLIGLAILIFGFGGFLLWSALAPLKSAAVAPGILVVESKRRAVQHLEGGMVAAIPVKEGDRVETGEVLIELSDVRAAANLGQLTAQQATALAKRDRLVAERDALPQPVFSFPVDGNPTLNVVRDTQIDLFEARGQALEGRLAVLEQQRQQAETEIAAVRSLLDANVSMRSLLVEELQGVETLNKRGYAPKTRVLQLRREKVELEGKIGEQRTRMVSLRQRVEELMEQRENARREFLSSVTDELEQVERQVQELDAMIGGARDVVNRVQIRAPRTGVVVGLNVATIGQVIAPGETMMEIVPENDNLVVEALVRPEDIDVVRPGLPAQVRLTAYSFRRVPPLNGSVSYVSADRITDARTRSSAYLVKVTIADARPAGAEAVELLPGMSAETMIVLGEKTPLEYLLEPITQTLERGMIDG